MSEISEGDFVVTPEGEKHRVSYFSPEGTKIELDDGATSYYPVSRGMDKLVKLSSPIRVRVDSEWQAEALVRLAVANDFKFEHEGMELSECVGSNLLLKPNGAISTKDYCEPDLTFVDDLPQITAWIEFHGESEDECGTCGGTGKVTHYQPQEGENIDCPNCTDDDGYSEPRPEDEKWREILAHVVAGQFFDSCNLGLETDNHLEPDQRAFQVLLNYIDELESELSDCREELGEVREDRDEWISVKYRIEAHLLKEKDRRIQLQERIEEAKGYLKTLVKKLRLNNDSEYLEDIGYTLDALDSDEGGSK